MADLKFTGILAELERIHLEMPDLRFGEVMQNALDLHKKEFNTNINDISSKQILTALEGFKTEHKERRLIAKQKKHAFRRI